MSTLNDRYLIPQDISADEIRRKRLARFHTPSTPPSTENVVTNTPLPLTPPKSPPQSNIFPTTNIQQQQQQQVHSTPPKSPPQPSNTNVQPLTKSPSPQKDAYHYYIILYLFSSYNNSTKSKCLINNYSLHSKKSEWTSTKN